MTFSIFLSCTFVALILEAFFSGSEMALISADRLALKKLAKKNNSGANVALKLLSEPETILVTTLVGTCLCVTFQAAAFTIFIAQNFGEEYEIYSLLVLSPIVLIFGELLPKTLFQRYSEQLSPKVAPIIRLVQIALYPITFILIRYTKVLSRRLQPIEELITGRHNPTHREELRYLLTYGKKETSLKSSERRMIRRILDFSRAQAKNAAIPLVNVDMIEDSISMQEALEAFVKFGHSRLPVYHERVDNIVGIVHVFDLYFEKDSQKTISQLMQSPFYTPESQHLDDLLYVMQKKGIQMAIVVDEYGGAVGILTLEDILEEIVGEIKDEYDEDKSLFKKISDKEFIIQGKMEIDSINENLKLGLPTGSYETLAGFLLEQFSRIPEAEDELFVGKLKFVVKKASSRAIQTVQVSVIDE
ncbi:MAG: hemolysin family protein [Bacteriovoracia bacterium]